MAAPRSHPRHERGASAVEYALLLAGIAAVVVTAIVLLGLRVDELYLETCDRIVSQARDGGCT